MVACPSPTACARPAPDQHAQRPLVAWSCWGGARTGTGGAFSGPRFCRPPCVAHSCSRAGEAVGKLGEQSLSLSVSVAVEAMLSGVTGRLPAAAPLLRAPPPQLAAAATAPNAARRCPPRWGSEGLLVQQALPQR